MAEKKTAPVILFTYNRPEHTRRTIEALAKNELAQDTCSPTRQKKRRIGAKYRKSATTWRRQAAFSK